MTRQAAGRGGVAGRGKKCKAALDSVVFDSLCMLRKEVDEGVGEDEAVDEDKLQCVH